MFRLTPSAQTITAAARANVRPGPVTRDIKNPEAVALLRILVPILSARDIAGVFVGMSVLILVSETVQPIITLAAAINVRVMKIVSAEAVCRRIRIPAITERRSVFLPMPSVQAITAIAQANAPHGPATRGINAQEAAVLRRVVPIHAFIHYVLALPTAIAKSVKL